LWGALLQDERRGKMKRRITIFTVSITCILLAYSITISYAGESYFPLNKGKSWTYIMSVKAASGQGGSVKFKKVNLGPQNLKGKKVVPQKFSAGNSTAFYFYVSDEKGVYEYAKQEPTDIEPKVYPAPDYTIRFPIKIGTSWDDVYKTLLLGQKIELPVKNSIVGISEDVYVSAGSFTKCVHVKEIGTINKDMGMAFGKAQVMVEQHSWFAPGVGLVRSVFKEKSNNLFLGSGEGSIELELYTK
jgi:hypothetical protein